MRRLSIEFRISKFSRGKPTKEAENWFKIHWPWFGFWFMLLVQFPIEIRDTMFSILNLLLDRTRIKSNICPNYYYYLLFVCLVCFSFLFSPDFFVSIFLIFCYFVWYLFQRFKPAHELKNELIFISN